MCHHNNITHLERQKKKRKKSWLALEKTYTRVPMSSSLSSIVTFFTCWVRGCREGGRRNEGIEKTGERNIM